ncbi:MAG: tRNA (adenosine(37)-N6)-threonylcarbamoyltransferase complex dimerization subunit type 1 TsaB [Flavobacteriaceae bacterium]
MTILAIDTSLDACSFALLRRGGGTAPVVVSEPMATGHAEIFFSLLHRLFAAAGVGPGDVGRIAVTVGPGSFTGIRVGLAAARGLGLAWKVAVRGATTLDVFAYAQLASGRPFAVLIDARRGAFYRQLYNVPGDISGPALVPAAAPLAGLGADVALAGPGARRVEPEGREILAAPEHLPIADLALMAAADHAMRPPAPLYLRDADARPQAHAALARL